MTKENKPLSEREFIDGLFNEIFLKKDVKQAVKRIYKRLCPDIIKLGIIPGLKRIPQYDIRQALEEEMGFELE